MMGKPRQWSRTLAGLAVALGLLGGVGSWRFRVTRPDYRLRQGQAALLREDYDKAAELTSLLETSGHFDHAHLLRGQSLLRQGHVNQALLEYNAIRRERKDLLAEASMIFGLGLYFHGHLAEAEKLLLHAVHVLPDNIDIRRGLAALYYDRGAMRDALRHLQKWAELANEDGMPYRFMGVIYQGLSATGPAVANYGKALERNLPSEVREAALVEFAQVHVERTEYAEALACLKHLSAETQAQPKVQECWAECLWGMGRHAEAVALLEPMLAAESASPRALGLRAKIHLAAGQDAAAAALLEKALHRDPHDCFLRYQLALLCTKQKHQAEADEQFRLLATSQQLFREMSDLNQQAIERPRDAAVRRRLADVCNQLNKSELAQMWLKAANSCPTDTIPNRPDAVAAEVPGATAGSAPTAASTIP
jgi:tetratricopeptide (TPR) repeat protein